MDAFLKLLDEKIADASANIASCERMGFPHAAWSQQVIVCEALRTAYLDHMEKIIKALEAGIDDETIAVSHVVSIIKDE